MSLNVVHFTGWNGKRKIPFHRSISYRRIQKTLLNIKMYEHWTNINKYFDDESVWVKMSKWLNDWKLWEWKLLYVLLSCDFAKLPTDIGFNRFLETIWRLLEWGSSINLLARLFHHFFENDNRQLKLVQVFYRNIVKCAPKKLKYVRFLFRPHTHRTHFPNSFFAGNYRKRFLVH